MVERRAQLPYRWTSHRPVAPREGRAFGRPWNRPALNRACYVLDFRPRNDALLRRLDAVLGRQLWRLGDDLPLRQSRQLRQERRRLGLDAAPKNEGVKA